MSVAIIDSSNTLPLPERNSMEFLWNESAIGKLVETFGFEQLLNTWLTQMHFREYKSNL